jgi:GDSL-like Lipase/Acylhydrolase family
MRLGSSSAGAKVGAGAASSRGLHFVPTNLRSDLRFWMIPAHATVVSGGAQSLVDASSYAATWTATSAPQRPVVGTDTVGAYLQTVSASHTEMLTSTGGLQSSAENHGIIAVVAIASGQAPASDLLGFGNPHVTGESAIGNYGTLYLATTQGFGGIYETSTTIDGATHVVESYIVGTGASMVPSMFIDGQPVLPNAAGAGTLNVVAGSGIFDRAGNSTPSAAKIYQAFGVAGSSVLSGGTVILGPTGARWKVLGYIGSKFPTMVQPTLLVTRGDSQVNGGLLTGADLINESLAGRLAPHLLAGHGKTVVTIRSGAPGDRSDQVAAGDAAAFYATLNPLNPVRGLVIWYGYNDVLQLSNFLQPPDFGSVSGLVMRILAQIDSEIAAARAAGINGPVVVMTVADFINILSFPSCETARANLNAGIRAAGAAGKYLVADIDAALYAVEPVPATHTQWRDDGLHLTKRGQYVVTPGVTQGGYDLAAQLVSDAIASWLP